MRTNTLTWLVYAVLVILAIVFNGEEHPFISNGPYPYGKIIFWLLFLVFTAYSFYCSRKENLFRTINTMLKLHWGRQIGIDLYLGLTLFMTFVCIHQESMLVAVLWMIPMLYFVNLSTLLYVALHYDSIVFFVMGVE